MSNTLLRMENIEKSFPGVKALSNANLELHAGEAVGLIGENGAGKSTLMNILGGVHQADSGCIYIDGQKVNISSVIDAQNNKIAFIHQELALVKHLTVAENIFLGREMKNNLKLVSKNKMNQEARKYLDIVGLDIAPTTLVDKLSTGQQQMVEIAKAFSIDARIIVMDEPTSSLSEKEVAVLYETVKNLKKRKVGLIYISHKMAEIFELTDTVVVMRDGAYIDTLNTRNTNTEELVNMMVGRELENYYTRTYNDMGDVVLSVNELSNDIDKKCNFEVRKGEILGFYGLIGAGRSELMQSVMGLRNKTGGTVLLKGVDITNKSTMEIQNQKIALLPEDRKVEGLVLSNTIEFNTTIAVLDQFIRHLSVDGKKEKAIVKDTIEKLQIKTPSMQQRVINLSGGNQQKVVLGKWLATNPDILIMDEPTRGIDIGAKAEIYKIMNELVKQGMAIIMISSELNEIINMCDRLLVMNGGRITGEVFKEEFNQDKILHLALGGKGSERK